MDRTREGTGYGINPLQPAQIDAWMRLRRIVPTAWQLDAIDRLDATRMQVYFESKQDGGEDVVIEDQPMTKRLFRALFPGRK